MATTNKNFRVKNGLDAGGDISTSGFLKSNNSSGDEGGQIDLAAATTNTTITTGVTLDVYQNKLRIFETGGTNRGFYLDITTGTAGAAEDLSAPYGVATTVGTNLLTLTNPSAISYPRINADNTVTARSAANTRTDLGGTTVGQSFFTLTNPSAITFPRINANNTVSALDAANFKAAIGAGPIIHAPVANYTIATTTSGTTTISGSAFSKLATLSASMTYLMEATLFIQSTIGSGTGSNLILGWNTGGGGGVTGNVQMMVNAGLAALTTSSTTTTSIQITNFSNSTLISSPTGTQISKVVLKGIVRTGSVSAYNIYPTWSVTSGTPGAPTSLTTLVGSYIQYTELSSSASDVSLGTWA